MGKALFEGLEGQNPFDIGFNDGFGENMIRYNAMVDIIPVKKDTDSETFCTLWFQGWNLGHAKRIKAGLPARPQFTATDSLQKAMELLDRAMKK